MIACDISKILEQTRHNFEDFNKWDILANIWRKRLFWRHLSTSSDPFCQQLILVHSRSDFVWWWTIWKKKIEPHLATDTSGLVVLDKESSVGCMCSEVVSYVIFLRILLDIIVTVWWLFNLCKPCCLFSRPNWYVNLFLCIWIIICTYSFEIIMIWRILVKFIYLWNLIWLQNSGNLWR